MPQGIPSDLYILGAAKGNPAATALLIHVFAAIALAADCRYMSTMNATPFVNMSMMPEPIKMPDIICGTGDIWGEDVQANQKMPAGKMKLPIIIGGSRSSGSTEPRASTFNNG